MMKKLMQKKASKKGFTLAELLIVVAIIAVLVAIAIPVFSAAKDKAEDAVHVANCRSAFAEAMVGYISGEEVNGKEITYAGDDAAYSVTVDSDTLKVTCDKTFKATSDLGTKNGTIEFVGNLDGNLSTPASPGP